MDIPKEVTEAILKRFAKCDVKAMVLHLIDQGAISDRNAIRYLVRQDFYHLMSTTKRTARDIQLELAASYGLGYMTVVDYTRAVERRRKNGKPVH